MPTREAGSPVIKNNPQRKNFHDSYRLGGYFITSRLQNNDIELSYQPHKMYMPVGRKHSITLKFEDCNKLGFIIYSFDDEGCNKDGFTNALNGRMNPAIYHYIKNIFHEHENHPASEDALLQPFVSNEPISFGKNEQDIICFYILQYKDKFESFITYNLIESRAAKKQINGFININKGINALGRIIEKGNTIKGEQEYFEFLREYATRKGWISKSLRTEIKKYTNEISRLLRDVTCSYNLCTTGLGIKYGKWGIFFGIAGIIVSATGILLPPGYDKKTPMEAGSTTKYRNNICRDIKDSLQMLPDNNMPHGKQKN